jgi:hypothetical protein
MRILKKLEVEYYSDGGERIKGVAYKFKIYKISILTEKYPELSLNFAYFPTVDDIVKILSKSIYPTLALDRDMSDWQGLCIKELQKWGLPHWDDYSMTSCANGISIKALHAYTKVPE